MIYMDHAATTPLRREVLQAMLPYMSEHYANASSSYALARASRRAIDVARAQVAALIGAQSDEIYMTSGGSEADNWALIGAVLALPHAWISSRNINVFLGIKLTPRICAVILL